MVNAFQHELAKGNVALDLFPEEELMLPFQRLQAEFGEPFTQVQPSEEFGEPTFELGYLDRDHYEENMFVLAAFIGQIYRLGKEHKSTRKSKKRDETQAYEAIVVI